MQKTSGSQSEISIHAPTKGATTFYNHIHNITIFQSTLPQRERLSGYLFNPKSSHFNPRSHKGSDSSSSAYTFCWLDFNPRSHKGSDNFAATASMTTVYFNPRSHKGSDQAMTMCRPCLRHFNPRSHKGSDANPETH